MVYPYTVKHKGVWYTSGSDVPSEEQMSLPVVETVPVGKDKEPIKKGRKPKMEV